MKSALVVIAVGPAHFIVTARRLIEVSRIPITGQSAFKIPTPLDTLIMVPIQHLHDDPFAATVRRRRLVFIFGIDDTDGAVRILKLDNVITDVVSRPCELLA